MWQFNSPEIVFGPDALSRLTELDGSRASIVTDSNLVDLGFAQTVQQLLSENGIESRCFSEVEPEPSVQTVLQAKESIAEFKPDWVVALGGGSCLDAAKVAWFLSENPGVELEEISPFVTYAGGNSRLVAIPTTSGTGADVSLGAVLTDREQNRKISIIAHNLQPDITLVDPSLVVELSPQMTADTGMDVVSHAVEGFASPWHNDFSDGLCLKAMQLVLDYLPRAYRDGSDLEARERMHNASTIAGLGMTNSSISLGHCLAHALGAVFPVPHGRLVGLVLPSTIEYTANGADTRYAEMAHFLHLPAASETEGAASMVAAIRDLAREIDQPLAIRELGIGQNDFEAALPRLVAKAAVDYYMFTTLRIPDDQELERLFRHAYEGKKVEF